MTIPHWVPEVDAGFDVTSPAITVYQTIICWARKTLREGRGRWVF